MAQFIVKTTFENYSPKDGRFRVETTIKIQFETSNEIYSPKDCKFKVETIEQKLKRSFSDYMKFFIKRRMNIEERQEKGNVEEKILEEDFESESIETDEDDFSLSSNETVST